MRLPANLVPLERIENKIFFIRGKKVMFDSDLAELYGVETKQLNQAVKRNKERFPVDFLFQLTEQENKLWRQLSLKSPMVTLNDANSMRSQFVTGQKNLKSQIVTSSSGYGGRRHPPYVFTEQGVAMLSSVLKSKQAIQVNIQIMRTFTKIREMIVSNKELRERIEALEKKYSKQFKAVFEAINGLLFDKIEKTRPPLALKTNDYD